VVNQVHVLSADTGDAALQEAEETADVDGLTFPPRDLREGPEPSFTDSDGADTMSEAADDAEPYFPPTDTVVRPRSREEEGLEWVGGFASTASRDSVQAPRPYGAARDDSEIAEDVLIALEEDALTTDLDILVRVRRGVVYLQGTVSTIEEAEAAEAAAAEVPGVVEVVEELTLS
jgi:hypothetical protein